MKIRKGFRWFGIAGFIVALALVLTGKILENQVTFYVPIVHAQAPAMTRSQTFTSSGTGNVIGQFGNGISLYRLQWQLVGGTISACTVSLQGSNDNSNWNTIVDAQTCTSTGEEGFQPGTYGYIRVNLSALTLGTATGITITVQGDYPWKMPEIAYNTTVLNSSSDQQVQLKTGPGVLHAFITGTSGGGTATTLYCWDGTTENNTAVVGTMLISSVLYAQPDAVFLTGLGCRVTGNTNGNGKITMWLK